MQTTYGRFESLIAELLAEPVAASSLETTAAEIARKLTTAMRGFKNTATDGMDATA